MDIFPKFIIETDNDLGDCLIISKCTYHKDLVTFKEKVKGGGWYSFKDGVFTFYGNSHDYGAATIEDIKGCIKNDNVFTSPFLECSIAKKYEFIYNIQTELIPLN